MRKLLFIILAVGFLSSCATTTNYSVTSSYIDYSKYTDKGFYITPFSNVNFDYTVVGDITVVVTPGYATDEKGNFAKELKHVSIEDALDELYATCVKKGANGAIAMQVNYGTSTTILAIASEGRVYEKATTIILTAVAIKR